MMLLRSQTKQDQFYFFRKDNIFGEKFTVTKSICMSVLSKLRFAQRTTARAIYRRSIKRSQRCVVCSCARTPHDSQWVISFARMRIIIILITEVEGLKLNDRSKIVCYARLVGFLLAVCCLRGNWLPNLIKVYNKSLKPTWKPFVWYV